MGQEHNLRVEWLGAGAGAGLWIVRMVGSGGSALCARMDLCAMQSPAPVAQSTNPYEKRFTMVSATSSRGKSANPAIEARSSEQMKTSFGAVVLPQPHRRNRAPHRARAPHNRTFGWSQQAQAGYARECRWYSIVWRQSRLSAKPCSRGTNQRLRDTREGALSWL